MGTDYLPTKESELKTFALNFATLIKATPADYGLVAADGTELDRVAQDYADKYDLAYNPATRTEATVDAKDSARITLTEVLRGYAIQIKSNRELTDQAKINLGIGVYDFTHTPIPAPSTRPLVEVVKVDVRRHELRFADSTTPDKKAKPTGVLGLQLFYHVGEASAGAPTDPLASRFHAFITRSTLKLDFSAADAGKTAWYYARWQTATGLTGPWSVVISMPIVG